MSVHACTDATAPHCLPLSPSRHHHLQRMWAIREGPSITRPVNCISYDVMQWGSHCTPCADAPENEQSEAEHTCTPAGLLYAHLEVLIEKLVFIWKRWSKDMCHIDLFGWHVLTVCVCLYSHLFLLLSLFASLSFAAFHFKLCAHVIFIWFFFSQITHR